MCPESYVTPYPAPSLSPPISPIPPGPPPSTSAQNSSTFNCRSPESVRLAYPQLLTLCSSFSSKYPSTQGERSVEKYERQDRMRENTREPHRHADRRNKYPSVEQGRGDDLSAPGAACEQIEPADDWAPSSLEVAYMSMLVPVEFADAGTMTGKHPKYLSNKLRVSIVAPGTNEASPCDANGTTNR
jgi:hypothetical protein